VYGWQLYLTLTDVDGKLLGQGILFALGIMFIILGNFLGKVRQNYFVGIKTPWTLNNEEVWQKTQRVGGWMMVIAGILLLIEAFFFQWAFSVMIGIIVLILIVPVVYSYVISRE
ncbi:MAG TPA: SdpI family protein, partial [bacterium]|nr:SdpI family protein [bacterium]